jgi:hypothetical protein
MFPTRRDVACTIGIFLAFLCVGWTTPRVILASDHDPTVIGVYALLCVTTISLTVGYFRHLRSNTPAALRQHTLEARRQVIRLLDAGFDMLAPCDGDSGTARLLIRMDGENAVIEKELWRGTRHYYVISPQGELTWEIFGSKLTRGDRRWLNSPLTAARLIYLVQALQSTYSPRQRIKMAS